MKAVLAFLVFPVLGLVLYFGVFASSSHPRASIPQPAPFSCASLLASLASLDAAGQIAPLCGAAAYPEVTP